MKEGRKAKEVGTRKEGEGGRKAMKGGRRKEG